MTELSHSTPSVLEATASEPAAEPASRIHGNTESSGDTEHPSDASRASAAKDVLSPSSAAAGSASPHMGVPSDASASMEGGSERLQAPPAEEQDVKEPMDDTLANDEVQTAEFLTTFSGLEVAATREEAPAAASQDEEGRGISNVGSAVVPVDETSAPDEVLAADALATISGLEPPVTKEEASENFSAPSNAGYPASAPKPPTAKKKEAEARLLGFYYAEEHQTTSSSILAERLPVLFTDLTDEAVPKVRAVLDSELVFRQNGQSADLRSVVYDELSDAGKGRVLTRIRQACRPPDRRQPGFVVLSDVDDTLLPGHDTFKVSGADRSWHLDGRLYPGVVRLHLELRAGLREAYGGDYSVMLTARPAFLANGLVEKLRRMCGEATKKPRMAILPGGANVVANLGRALAGNYSTLGETKVKRLLQYESLFPEYAGRFVFIGDDGQADVEAAERMLTLEPCTGSSFARKLVAFVAIKAVMTDPKGKQFVVSPEDRRRKEADLRRHFAPEPASGPLPAEGDENKTRHRFFYFETYEDLARQLGQAGWIKQEQVDAILRAAKRDRSVDIMALARSCDLRGLRQQMDTLAEQLDECDEVEQQAFTDAACLLPFIAAAHVKVQVPPAGTTQIVIRMLKAQASSSSGAKLCFPSRELSAAGNGAATGLPEGPHLVMRCLDPAPETSNSPRVYISDREGCLRIPYPCDKLDNTGKRCVLDYRSESGGTWARCFIILDDSTGATREGDRSNFVHLLTASDTPDASYQIGDLEFSLHFVRRP
eukprot:TRINITY_DN108657_c0_g1_i1.p1 TRINITY_DN108657_c0_g1~~TRINITY_DN108657_c0_g1_i1.p1  ORF type:complete len:771 (-),score=168.47 TRINITY_DN108657_c0_g1_i1:12-2324(-)